MTDKVFIVLGMHRSATSLAAKGLRTAGVNMGARLLGARKSQPAGHWEDKDFLELNEMLLKAAGGTWRNPPTPLRIRRAINRGGYTGKAAALFAARTGMWGWKDPRTPLLWDLYEPLLPDDTILVCVFRRPKHVARSLASRNKMSAVESKELTDRTNRAILDAAARHVGLKATFE